MLKKPQNYHVKNWVLNTLIYIICTGTVHRLIVDLVALLITNDRRPDTNTPIEVIFISHLIKLTENAHYWSS
jgi:hypothetical protein